MFAEQHLDGCDRGARAFDQRMALGRIADRGSEHVGEPQRAVVPQQQHPGVEHARHACRQHAGARHDIETEAAIMRDRRASGRRTLATQHFRAAFADIEQDCG